MAKTNKDISDFLLAEYENIAKAHFNAQEILSRWVRFYFLVVAAPLTVLAIQSGKGGPIDILKAGSFFSVLAGLISIIGMFISFIIFDIRLDAALYARSVNGIRQYFLQNATVEEARHIPQYPSGQAANAADAVSCVVLPTDTTKPSLTDLSINGWIFVLMFAFINSLYFCYCACSLLVDLQPSTPCGKVLCAVVVGLFVVGLIAIHPVIYRCIGKHKEQTYAKVMAT